MQTTEKLSPVKAIDLVMEYKGLLPEKRDTIRILNEIHEKGEYPGDFYAVLAGGDVVMVSAVGGIVNIGKVDVTWDNE